MLVPPLLRHTLSAAAMHCCCLWSFELPTDKDAANELDWPADWLLQGWHVISCNHDREQVVVL